MVQFFCTVSLMAATIPDSTLDAIWKFSYSRLKATTAAISATQYPRGAPPTSGKWNLVSASDWVSGFFPGCLWLAYEKSGDTTYRNAAQRWTATLDGQKNNTGTHDVGFMIFCSYGNGYRLLATNSYLPVIQKAAQSLSTRYRSLAGVIDSWDFAPYNNGWEEIIDNMMNLELLFWTAENSGNATYRAMAQSHAEKAMTNHFRADSSTYHVVRYSTTTGAMTSQETRQGYSNQSCWARGQAWAVYGFTMAYRFTNDARFLATARKAADYYIRHLPEDKVPYWDFNAPGIPADTVPRDVSASAVVASGLLELCTYTGGADSIRYHDAAVSMLTGIWTPEYRAADKQASILDHATGSRKEGHEVDMGIIYADYYFLEALLRYEKLQKPLFTMGNGIPAYRLLCNNQKQQSARFNLLGRFIQTKFKQYTPGLIINTAGNGAFVEYKIPADY
jgi:rhamnogalacturonyl hydrolase YesR